MIKEEAFCDLLVRGPEVAVYMAINEMGSFMFHMEHDMSHGRIPESSWPAIDADIQRCREQQVALAKSLTRFGLQKPFDENDKPTEEYWKWFRWWNSWHKGMSDEEWRVVNPMIDLTMTPEQIARCRPQGDWHG
jgi:hypothetical protein